MFFVVVVVVFPTNATCYSATFSEGKDLVDCFFPASSTVAKFCKTQVENQAVYWMLWICIYAYIHPLSNSESRSL
jgi:hypothetical protein